MVLTVGSLPYSGKKFFSAAERSFCEILRTIAPDHTVFAKVRLSDVMFVSPENEADQTSHRVQSRHLDFLVCDMTLAPVLAVQLDDSSHPRRDRNARDEFVDTLMAAAQIPIVRIPAAYSLDDIRRLIFPHLHSLGPVC